MITHSRRFEQLAVAPVKTTDVQVARQVVDTFDYYDDGLMWSSSDVLMSVQMDAVGTFLGAAIKKATVKLLGLIDTSQAEDTFQIRLGLYNRTTSLFDYTSQGFFVVEDVEYNYDDGYTTITMYDYMWRANKTTYSSFATSSGFTFPATVTQFAERMASAIGAELMSGFTNLPNAGYVIQADPFINDSNATLRTVIQELAATTGTTARISDTTLMFKGYEINQALL